MVLDIYLSGQNNTNPDASLGGVISTTTLQDAEVANLYDNINRKEVLLTTNDYRCFYIKNEDVTKTIRSGKIFIDEFPEKTIVEIGLDPVGPGDGSTFGVAQSIVNETTAPTGVTFYGEKDGTFSLPLPTLRPEQSIAVWIKRTTEGGPSLILTVGISASGDDDGLTADEGSDALSFGELITIEKNPSNKIGEAKIGFAEIQ